MRLGSVVIWLTGNDIYNPWTLLPSIAEDRLQNIATCALHVTDQLLREAEQVLVMGPLPRLTCDMVGLNWEHSGAFHLERRLSTTSRG